MIVTRHDFRYHKLPYHLSWFIVYTRHQLDCLQQLGIKLLVPSGLESANVEAKNETKIEADTNIHTTESAVASVNEINIKKTLLDDLQIMFPDYKIEGNRLILTDSFSWLFQGNTTRVIATNTQLITPLVNTLTVKQLRQIWSCLQEHVVNNENKNSAS